MIRAAHLAGIGVCRYPIGWRRAGPVRPDAGPASSPKEAMSDPATTATTRMLDVQSGGPRRELPRFALRLRLASGVETALESAAAVVRVGSRPGNDLVVADEAVSRIHFEIAVDAHGFRLRDLGSTNGTVVNGARALDVYLADGARIVAGTSEIAFSLLPAPVEVALSKAEQFGGLIGKSAAMRELFAKLERVAPTDSTVLVEGESGTGKELVAEAIHGASARREGPFVVFDCAAVPASLVEAELFGHEKGAFTGASVARPGCVAEADGGTLFLDEIGELPLDLQAKLLRVLEKREFRRVGARATTRVDIRVVAATNRDLAREVNVGSFREDLYYRLAVVRLTLPTLSERSDDIPLLAEHFVRQAFPLAPERAAAVLAGISGDNWLKLKTHPWRGNVRELRNVIHRALALAGPAGPDGIAPASVRTRDPVGSSASPPPPAGALPIDLERPFLEQRNDLVARFEREYVLGMLERHGGRISPAAQAAGLDRSHFRRLLGRSRG